MTKAHYHRQFNFALDSVDDADIIERIVSQPSQIAYLRNLIRRDIRDERENAKLRELLKYNGAIIEACTSEILDHVGVPYIVGPAGVAQALMEATAMLVNKRYDFDPPSFYKEDK